MCYFPAAVYAYLFHFYLSFSYICTCVNVCFPSGCVCGYVFPSLFGNVCPNVFSSLSLGAPHVYLSLTLCVCAPSYFLFFVLSVHAPTFLIHSLIMQVCKKDPCISGFVGMCLSLCLSLSVFVDMLLFLVLCLFLTFLLCMCMLVICFLFL